MIGPYEIATRRGRVIKAICSAAQQRHDRVHHEGQEPRAPGIDFDDQVPGPH